MSYKDIPCTLNPGDSTKFQVKDCMYLLDLPLIPRIPVEDYNDLENVIANFPEGIIIKPIVGMLGYGVEYINNKHDMERLINIGRLSKWHLSRSIVSPYIPADFEPRYIFYGNQILLNSIVERSGQPGNEYYGQKKLVPLTNRREIEIVHAVREMTGWRFGSVDFRGDYVLEIHGSSTGTVAHSSPTNGTVLYDLNEYLVKQCENEFNSHHR